MVTTRCRRPSSPKLEISPYGRRTTTGAHTKRPILSIDFPPMQAARWRRGCTIEIETWVNEGGGGGEDDESAPRPGGGRQRQWSALSLVDMLAEMGHDVCALETAATATVSTAVRCRPDLLIVDVWLGEGSGISAVEEICRMGPTAHLFVSGDTSKVKAAATGYGGNSKAVSVKTDLAWAIQRAWDGAAAACGGDPFRYFRP